MAKMVMFLCGHGYGYAEYPPLTEKCHTCDAGLDNVKNSAIWKINPVLPEPPSPPPPTVPTDAVEPVAESVASEKESVETESQPAPSLAEGAVASTETDTPKA